eukprot:TRINITY_DN16010_c0_g2_i1.p1 TRINITY_DN16010_c0_g2~~TRINITY_DN16010_c0_g2_i1.p1  ORF type:complete len:111 (+),score=6.79 TRINITY_DN16010_c0_g2_i1:227-559(+)
MQLLRSPVTIKLVRTSPPARGPAALFEAVWYTHARLSQLICTVTTCCSSPGTAASPSRNAAAEKPSNDKAGAHVATSACERRHRDDRTSAHAVGTNRAPAANFSPSPNPS